MGVITSAPNPWGQAVPVHIAWYLLWVSLFAGLAFLVVHAVWIRLRAKPEEPPEVIPPETASCIPEKVPRHSLPARIFHWVMAAAMLTLLVTAFLPKAGLRFPWLYLHWAAGTVLIVAIVFHIVHAVFFMDFWSIWPGKTDLKNAWRAFLRAFVNVGPGPGKPGKYPIGNKLYHLAIVACGLCMAITGLLMMSRVRTPFFTRNPYLFDDMTWGIIYSAARVCRGGIDRARDDPCVLCPAAREAAGHEGHGLRRDGPRLLPQTPRSGAVGLRRAVGKKERHDGEARRYRRTLRRDRRML